MNGTVQRFDARAWVLFAIMAVVWGIPYLFIKVAVDSYSPASVVAGRTEQTFSQTSERAAAAKLKVEVLEPWYDIDEPNDLARLYADPALSTYTRAVLASRADIEL